MDDALDSALSGRVFANRYRIEERIGDGAMGVVYRARHIKIGRPFAVKVLHPQLLTNHKVLRRFEREAEVAATLRHDNVIGVVDVGESDDMKYLVMDFAEGAPLSALIAYGPISSQRVLKMARQLCDGLQHAHDAGLIHRDFKPDNVIVQTDRDGTETPRIVDFGIALLREDRPPTGDDRERLTTAGIVLGTPHYMAPEHASGGKIDHRIDLFALGVLCFEMLAGRLPFDGDGVDVARANMMFDLPAIRSVSPQVETDPLLEAFVKKLAAREVEARFQTAKEARAMLDLIETDRNAAAALLGLSPRRPVTIAPEARRMVAMPMVTASAPILLDDTIEMPVVPTKKRRRRIIPLVIAAGIVLVGAGIAAAIRVDEPVKSAPIAIVAPVPRPAPAIMVPPPLDAAPIVVEPPVIPPAPAKITTRVPVRQTMPPVAHPIPPTVMPPPDQTPTSTELAQYYAAVGRKLGYAEKYFGQPITLELWPRYRRIRIQAVLARPEDRRDAVAVLRDLEADIDAAMHAP